MFQNSLFIFLREIPLVNLLIGLSICFTLSGQEANAQKDSTLLLNSAQVVEYRSQVLSVGLKSKSIDTAVIKLFQGTNLSDLLASYGPLYVKSNGPGNLSTSSFRGGSSSHTALIWNGFNINNSMNGLVDLSLIPVGLSDNINIQYGASTSLWGSGAIGGVILLSQLPKFNSGWTASIATQSTHLDDLSSINGYSRNMSLAFGSKEVYASIKSYGQTSDNNYRYAQEFIDQSSSGISRSLHAWNRSEGLLADINWKVADNQLLSVHYWYQDAYREVPRTLHSSVAAYNFPYLKDKTHRASMNYAWMESNWTLNIRSAYFHKNLLYYDSFIEEAPSISFNFINEAEWIYNIDNKWIIDIGLNQNFSNGANSNYADTVNDQSDVLIRKQRESWALFGSVRRKALQQRATFSINIRQEVVDNNLVPFTFSLGGDYTINPNLGVLLNASKVYRIPNLNDLYWNPGGNPDLLSEDGFALEGTTWARLKGNDKTQFKIEFTAFYRKVDNWIQWVPGLIWSPENLLEVESYGFEFNPEFKTSWGKMTLDLKLPFFYTISRNIKKLTGSEETHFKQLIYTPIYRASGWLQLAYKNWGLSYNHTYTGYTYTATDHSDYIEPYDVGNIRLGYSGRIKHQTWSIWLSTNNLFGEAYQIVQDRPMPLRNYQIAIQFNFNQNNLKK